MDVAFKEHRSSSNNKDEELIHNVCHIRELIWWLVTDYEYVCVDTLLSIDKKYYMEIISRNTIDSTF